MNDYATSLGQLVGNFHSLELALRAHLSGLDGTMSTPFTGVPLERLRKGSQVPEDAFTNYDSLSALIRKYNASLLPRQRRLTVDLEVVSLRDAIAHGRVFAKRPEFPLFLLKFGKPKGGVVEVAFAARMTPAWIARQRRRIGRLILRVAAAGSPGFPTGGSGMQISARRSLKRRTA